VDVSRKDKDGKHPPCGRSKAKTSSKGYPKCRPSVKVSSKTPKTSGSMSEGQKRAATKRKRAKKQGVGGKPTVVKAEVKRPIQVLNDFNRRQTSGEDYEPNFTMMGDVPLYGFVNPKMGPQVYGQQGKQGPIYDDENHRILVEGGVFMGDKQWQHQSAPRQQIEIPTLKGSTVVNAMKDEKKDKKGMVMVIAVTAKPKKVGVKKKKD